MELTLGRAEIEKDCRYTPEVQDCGLFVVRESAGPDYTSAVILLRNLGERKDTTSLEREALVCAIRHLRHSMEMKKP